MDHHDFEKTLNKAVESEISAEEALLLLRESWFSPNRTLELFKAACEVRRSFLNDEVALFVCLGPHRVCKLDPLCRYCWVNVPEGGWDEEGVVKPDEAAQALEELYSHHNISTPYVWVGGGSDLKSSGKDIVNYVTGLRDIIKRWRLKPTLSGLPYIDVTNLKELKELGICEVACPFETLNEEVFRETKPGDDLKMRMEEAKLAEKAGIGFAGGFMVGIHYLVNPSFSLDKVLKEYVDHIFMLRRLRTLTCILVYAFNPLPGIPLADKPREIDLNVARVGALTRLVCKHIDVDICTNSLELSLISGASRVSFGFIQLAKKPRPWRLTSLVKAFKVGPLHAVSYQDHVLRCIRGMDLRVRA